MTDSYGSTRFANESGVPIISDNQHYTIRSKVVPAGNYAIFASGVAVDVDHDAGFLCDIRAAGSVVAQSGLKTESGGIDLTAISIVGQASLPSGGTIKFTCQTHEPGAEVHLGSLVALKVDALH